MKPKNVVVMLGLVLACVLAYFLMPSSATNPVAGLPAYMPSDLAKSDVTDIVASGQGSVLHLKKREGTRDKWEVVAGTELVRADGNKVDDLLAALATQSVREKITAQELAVNDHGLKQPLFQIEFTVGGEKTTLRYGSMTREGTKVYMDTGPGTDAWVVSKDAFTLAMSYVAGDVKDVRLFDLTPYDVAKFEVMKGGVVVAQLEKDLSQIWSFTQPFKGYPNPQKFETALNQIVNVNVDKWVELGTQTPSKYGLDPPAYRITATPKGEGKRPEVVLVGTGDDKGCFAMEEGTKSVVRLGPGFWRAVSADPNEWRDPSFTRLGIDGTAVDVHLPGPRGHYRLEKHGSTWDVTVPGDDTPNRPGDGEKIARLLDKLRSWETVEFLDKQAPEDFGVTGKDFVEISLSASGRDAPGKLVLLIGNEGPPKAGGAKTYYAQRKGDGGLERVDAAPLEEMLKGPEQYFRGQALAWPAEWVTRIARIAGTGDVGKTIQEFNIERADAESPWESKGPGLVGSLDPEAINGILAAVRSIKAEWVPLDPAKDNETMGFIPPKAETLTLEAHVSGVIMEDPGSLVDPKLYIGKKRADGRYFARLADSKHWAFLLDEETVEKLKRAIAK
jgi:hypothetical protein